MRTRVVIQLCLLYLLGAFLCGGAAAGQDESSGYGPAVKSFLDLMRHEENELEFQIRHNEITRKDYTRSKCKIALLRQTVLKIAKDTGEDHVPELHVVAASEVDQLIEDGTKALRRIKRGETIADKWRYLGSVTRGEVFYIFERLSKH